MLPEIYWDGLEEMNSRADEFRVAEGYTDTERLLTQLARRSFLSLWSYSNIYRDQKASRSSKEGKEVCDLLVVFGKDIIIFSDKYCNVPQASDVDVAWARWFKRAILASAKQVWGAERWIRDEANQLFLDRQCTDPLPIDLPNRQEAKIHRIVVANGLQDELPLNIRHHTGLKIIPSIEGDDHLKKTRDGGLPYVVGNLCRSKGFVHVFDDTSLVHILSTLDTISDFVSYLGAKEELFATPGWLGADSELDLLASFLMTFDRDGNHMFPECSRVTPLWIPSGAWEAFIDSGLRMQQIEADRISYAWDKVIEITSRNIREQREYYTTLSGVREGERILRILAGESRFRRRLLARSLYQVASYNSPDKFRFARTIQSNLPGKPIYIFMSLIHPSFAGYDDYRIKRREMLQAYCHVAKLKFPGAETIVGIATEYGTLQPSSFDLVHFDARDFTNSEWLEAERLSKSFQIYTHDRAFEASEYEYPVTGARPQIVPAMKGYMRNRPCPCGSGKKFKHCCGYTKPHSRWRLGGS